MVRTLYGKLALLLLGLFLFTGLFHLFLTIATTRAFIREADQRLNAPLARYLVSRALFLKDGKANEEALKESFQAFMEINPAIELYLLDREGNILSYAAPPGKVKRKAISLAPIERFLQGSGTLPIMGDDPRDPGGKKVFSAATVPASGATEGYLYVILGGEEQDTVMDMLKKSYILRLSSGILVAGLLFALAAGLFLFHLFTRRLRHLTREIEGFRDSDFSEPAQAQQLPLPGPEDEIDRVRNVFREMSARIISQVSEIRRVDSLRREMLGGISHDLRTPLSSLRGYIETVLMKEGEITDRERKNYLETALKQTDRLGNLVSELFELAKLEAGDAAVSFEPFHLGELVQDMVLKLRIIAERRGVALEAGFPEDLPPVHADVGLVERAIQNLVENAIRYTGENGTVTLTLSPAGSTVSVAVKDEGPGIAPEDLPFIFDRFYRPKRDEGKDPDRAGLGLAITKRIVELHGSTIAVSSPEGSGTTFTFTLPTGKG
ncbi:MAG: sensor histidine kinase [Deltaproteobacteria bacterium]|nr:sensor histidine kinase [Deltaproteobacteria bacterium]